MHFLCASIFGAIVLKLRFKIDVVVMIVIIINSVLNLQVSTASLPHDCEPCEIKVVSNHTCSLHTCVCAGSRRVRVHLSGFRWQGISSTPGGFLKCPIPVQVCVEQKVCVKERGYNLHQSFSWRNLNDALIWCFICPCTYPDPKPVQCCWTRGWAWSRHSSTTSSPPAPATWASYSEYS